MDKFQGNHVLFFAVLVIAGLVACSSRKTEKLDRLFEAPEFSLQNCTGEKLSSDDLKGRIWIVDFVFTRCGGPCPLMTQRLLSLQKSLKEKGLQEPPLSVRLLSITVDPAYDTPSVLKSYALEWGADLDGWYFLTGPPESTLELIREGFKITAIREGSGSDHDMSMPNIVHSTSFYLVDQEGWVRKIYHLDEPGLSEEIIDGIMSLAGS
jgi:protein SCO1/2